MPPALCGDPLQLLRQPLDRRVGDGEVIPSVVPDLEAVAVELGDFVPRHVVAAIRLEVEALGDEERRRKPILQQQRSHDGVVGLRRVVKRKHHRLCGRDR